MDRTCGGCTVCCFTHDIINDANNLKPSFTWCEHCDTSNGCRIYPNHPFVCEHYQCEYLNGFGSEEFRPDRIGVVIDNHYTRALGDIWQIFEAREGALDSIDVWKITKILLDNNFCVCHRRISGKNIFFVPDGFTLSNYARERLIKEGGEITSFPILGI